MNIGKKIPSVWFYLIFSGIFVFMNSIVTNEDCMELMRRYPDKHFDLAVVDPPYGIDITNQSQGKGGGVAKKINYKKCEWDKNYPEKKYFDELIRVSKNQIIWGANHFIGQIPYNSSCWLIWDKENGETDFADCELAWTSFPTAVRRFKWKWAGMLQQNMKEKEVRIHPTQKPVALYRWIYKNYLPDGGKVLDTHLGSGSNRIAADMAGNIEFTACELDTDYFLAQEKRWKEYKSQLVLFA